MKLPKWIIVVLTASLFFNIKASIDIGSMKNEIRNMRGNINSMERSLENTVSNSMYNMEEVLRKEASIVNEFKYEYLEHKDKRVDYLLTLKPKVYNEGEKLSFLLKAGKNNPELVPTDTVDNVTFTAKVNMSIFDAADIDLVIDDGKSKKTEKLESIYPAVEKLKAKIDARPLGGSMRMGTDNGNSVLIMSSNYELIDHGKPEDDPPSLKDVILNIEVNGKIIDTLPMTWEGSPKYDRHLIELTDYKIPCKAGDEIIIYATAQDYKGFNYKCYLEGWTVKADGGLDHSPGRYHFGDVEVY